MNRQEFDKLQENHKTIIDRLLEETKPLGCCNQWNDRGDWGYFYLDSALLDASFLCRLVIYPYCEFKKIKGGYHAEILITIDYDVARYVGYPDEDGLFSDYDLPF